MNRKNSYREWKVRETAKEVEKCSKEVGKAKVENGIRLTRKVSSRLASVFYCPVLRTEHWRRRWEGGTEAPESCIQVTNTELQSLKAAHPPKKN